MYARISFEWGARDKVKAVSDEAWKELTAADPDVFPEDRNAFASYSDPYVDLQVVGPVLSKLGIEYTVKRMKGLRPIGPPVETLGGAAVHIHVPNFGLLQMTEVRVAEDCCTDMLQTLLDEGWRILCVCPPNSQRRPDYILGRTKPTAETKPY